MKKTVAQDATNRQVSHDDQQIIYNSSRSIVGPLSVRATTVSPISESVTATDGFLGDKVVKKMQQSKRNTQLTNQPNTESFNSTKIRSVRTKLSALSSLSKALTLAAILGLFGGGLYT